MPWVACMGSPAPDCSRCCSISFADPPHLPACLEPSPSNLKRSIEIFAFGHGKVFVAIDTHQRFKCQSGLGIHDCLSVGLAYRLHIVENRFLTKSEYRYEVLEKFWRTSREVFRGEEKKTGLSFRIDPFLQLAKRRGRRMRVYRLISTSRMRFL